MSADAPTPRRALSGAREAASRSTPGRLEVPPSAKGAAVLVVGERYGDTRWTIARSASPGARRGRSRARVLARCSCGLEKVLFVEDLAGGRTGGCRSKACAARWDAAQELRRQVEAMLDAFLRAG